jgi:branched-subunit amino acid aminotransferase/4-amino-4-deoxychorismate lyase
MPDYDHESLEDAIYPLRSRSVSSIKALLQKSAEMHAPADSQLEHELLVTILVVRRHEYDNAEPKTQPKWCYEVYAHACLLSVEEAPTAAVTVFDVQRANPLSIHSQWAEERATLAKSVSTPADSASECILCDKEDQLMEGAETNFFVVVDQVVYTAGDDVLLGTMRELALLQCDILGVTISFEAPKWGTISQWGAAFITGTRFGMTRITEFTRNSETHRMPEDGADFELAKRLQVSPVLHCDSCCINLFR